jgi:hypothetical protein
LYGNNFYFKEKQNEKLADREEGIKKIIINVPRFLKVWEIIFFSLAKHIMGLCSGQFRGQKGLSPLEKSLEMPHYMFCPRQKNILLDFQHQRYIGIFFIPAREREREGGRESKRERAKKRKG